MKITLIQICLMVTGFLLVPAIDLAVGLTESHTFLGKIQEAMTVDFVVKNFKTILLYMSLDIVVGIALWTALLKGI